LARPYSFVNAPSARPHEFYYLAEPENPLAPRLARLEAGDTLFVEPHAAGVLTLAEVPQGRHLWLLASGTALGPFLSILNTEAPWQRFERVVLVHAVRRIDDLSYRDLIQALAAQHPGKFAFVPVVSREPAAFALGGRIPKAIGDGRLEERAGIPFDARWSQVMICGNREMVADTVAALQQRGLKKHSRRDPGQITLESYW
jgi:ferredoxin--NADP+ reductase